MVDILSSRMKGATIALNACGEDGAQRKSAFCLTDVNPAAQFRDCANFVPVFLA